MVLIVCVQRRDAEQLYDSACIQGSEVAGWHGTRNTLFGPVRPSAIHACGAGNQHHCCEASSCFHTLIFGNSATCLSTSYMPPVCGSFQNLRSLLCSWIVGARHAEHIAVESQRHVIAC